MNEDLVNLEPARKALAVHAALCVEYGCPIRYFANRDPLSELVSSLLSHRTKNKDSREAFGRLKRVFPNWEAVRDGAVETLQQAIAPVTWPEQKAPRIQAVLRTITHRRGSLDLSFLGTLTVKEARAWLEELRGVGPKTSAATLLFSHLRLPALPVDSHHHRVAQRLGLLEAKVAVGPAHAVLEAYLPPDWEAQQVYDHHEVFMLHGQRCCHYKNPECERCAAQAFCQAYSKVR